MFKKDSLVTFAPALGLIAGSVVGDIIGLVTNNNIALSAAVGSGIGLVTGSIIYSSIAKKKTNDSKETGIVNEETESEKKEKNKTSNINETSSINETM